MKKILNKENIDDSLLKGFIAVTVFQIAYIFVYTILMSDYKPFIFIANNGYPVLYVLLNMMFGGLPYILCGYLLMIGRNKWVRLREKNAILCLMIFGFHLLFYLGVSLFQLIFIYRNVYEVFITSNLPLLRSVLFVELSRLEVNLLMLASTIIAPLAIYLGGILRLKALKKEGYNG